MLFLWLLTDSVYPCLALCINQRMSKANNSERLNNVAHPAKGKSYSSIARAKDQDFGGVIRRRRRELDLTQDELASRIETSTLYVGLLESGKRHPSGRIVMRLAEV